MAVLSDYTIPVDWILVTGSWDLYLLREAVPATTGTHLLMTPEYRPPHYHFYLLTAWEERREDHSPAIWRFGLEDVRDTGHRHVFVTLEEVMLFVQNEIDHLSSK